MQTAQVAKSWRDELQKVVELFSSKTFPQYAAAALINSPAKPCTKWSFGNQLLTMIAGTNDARGFRQWNEVGRYVKKGSHAFYILAPLVKNVKRKDEDTGEEEEVTRIFGFKGVAVFRYEDTDGQELPVYKPRDIPPLMDVAEKFGLKVKYEQLAGAYGAATYNDKTITLATEDWSVFFHELAHQVHRTFDPKNTHGEDPEAETIAELCSAVLSRLYGRPVDNWAWNYIGYYAKEKSPEAVGRACLKILQKTEKVLKLIIESATFGNLVQLFSAEYLEKYDILEEGWTDDKYPDAKQRRDRRARELRKKGWTVEIRTYNYADLLRCMYYGLEARRGKV